MIVWMLTSAPILAAVGVYLVSLIVVTVIAVIFFGAFNDWYVVPCEYVLPVGPAILAYRRARAERTRSA